MTDSIVIPEDLKPADGRFASGPSKVRPEQVATLAASGATYLGTSHRQAPDAASAATCSGRTLDGPLANRPSAGLRPSGMTMLSVTPSTLSVTLR